VDVRRSAQADQELVRHVAAGSEDALAELFDRHSGGVYRLAIRMVGDHQVAEEVMQETYLALWNRAELFSPERGSVEAWLLTIARNRAVDRLRAAGRRGPAVSMTAMAGQDEDDQTLDRVIASGTLLGAAPPPPDPETVIDAQWLRDEVRSALSGLPETERICLELAYYEELSQTEVATRLGWPLGTVKTRTRRALARLRYTLADVRDPDAAVTDPADLARARAGRVA
jgi:RNA polymerase sigma-70 factor (ECF subfamily)